MAEKTRRGKELVCTHIPHPSGFGFYADRLYHESDFFRFGAKMESPCLLERLLCLCAFCDRIEGEPDQIKTHPPFDLEPFFCRQGGSPFNKGVVKPSKLGACCVVSEYDVNDRGSFLYSSNDAGVGGRRRIRAPQQTGWGDGRL